MKCASPARASRRVIGQRSWSAWAHRWFLAPAATISSHSAAGHWPRRGHTGAGGSPAISRGSARRSSTPAHGDVVGVDQDAVAAARVAVEELHAPAPWRQSAARVRHARRGSARCRPPPAAGRASARPRPRRPPCHSSASMRSKRVAPLGRHLAPGWRRRTGGCRRRRSEVAHAMTGGLQRGGEGAHRGEDRQHLRVHGGGRSRSRCAPPS